MRHWYKFVELEPIFFIGFGHAHRYWEWGVEIGIALKRHADAGEIRWHFFRTWIFPRVGFIWRENLPAPDCINASAWTGMDHEIVGFKIGSRGWIWPRPAVKEINITNYPFVSDAKEIAQAFGLNEDNVSRAAAELLGLIEPPPP